MSRISPLPSADSLQAAFLDLQERGFGATARLPLFAARCWSATAERAAYRRFEQRLCNTAEVAVPRWYWNGLTSEARGLFYRLSLGQEPPQGTASPELPETLLTHGKPRWRVVRRFKRYVLHSRPEVSADATVYFGDDTLFLMDKARALLPPGEPKVLDLCCGSGGVGLALPPFSGTVLGVDIHEPALRLAELSAAAQGLSNYRYRYGDVESVLDDTYDLIVGNPPTLPPELGGRATLYATGSSERLLRLLDRLVGSLTPEGQALLTVFSVAHGRGETAPDALRREVGALLHQRRGHRYTVRRQFPLDQGRWLRHVALALFPQSRGLEAEFSDLASGLVQLPALAWRRRP